MKEGQSKQKTNVKFNHSIMGFEVVSKLFGIHNSLTFYGELEVEPYSKFSIEFQAEYWYVKYSLLSEGSIQLQFENFQNLFQEREINVIWFNITDKETFSLNCKDGDWYLSFSKLNESVENAVKQFI